MTAHLDDYFYYSQLYQSKMPTALDLFKYVYSISLLLFSCVIVIALIFSGKTKISQDVHPAFAFVLIWIAIIWMSMVEGGQASLVGLPPVDRELYRKSHPTTYRICSLAHKGDNLDRYLMGRQFMVLVLVFTTNQCGAPVANAEVLGLPALLTQIFLGSGFAMFLMTANIGQLAAQVNASRCMLDYINNSFMTVTLYVALAIEMSGLLHVCYLIQYIFTWLAGEKVQSREEPMSLAALFLFCFRVCMSLLILVFSFAVTLSALFQGKTTMWEGVPMAVSVVLFFVFMAIIGALEGMQIAFLAVAKMSRQDRAKHKWAVLTCDLLFKGDAHNLAAFMVGRQMCVTLCFFVVARVTSLAVDVKGGDETLFGVPAALQEFFNTGLLGAIITTIVASISWQLVASAFPVAFLSNPMCYGLLRFCLFLEWTGICAASWVLAMAHKKVATFKFDEVYIGTPEERKKRKKPDRKSKNRAGRPRVPVPPMLDCNEMPLDMVTELEEDMRDRELSVQEQIAVLEAQRLRLTETESKRGDIGGDSSTDKSDDIENQV